MPSSCLISISVCKTTVMMRVQRSLSIPSQITRMMNFLDMKLQIYSKNNVMYDNYSHPMLLF
ncbi:hypothetical protein T10_3753 [Trichinella papuae]|uniref:Uncharacterized protein n=1 Tax=Trichinella papuae TaxID=268474 RepID=A0A0V1M371_9BILA|nr:hypothetical protein T10_3753 [Trichinella papuae]